MDDADQHYLAAQDAIEAGDLEKAISELSLSIELRPDAWAYAQRAKAYALRGEDDKANQDIAKGLEIDPGNSELEWLRDEMKRPAAKRFSKDEQIKQKK